MGFVAGQQGEEEDLEEIRVAVIGMGGQELEAQGDGEEQAAAADPPAGEEQEASTSEG